MAAPWQEIVSSARVNEENISINVGKGSSWWAVSVTTVTLACGHKKVYRGSSVPSKKVRCKKCPEVSC